MFQGTASVEEVLRTYPFGVSSWERQQVLLRPPSAKVTIPKCGGGKILN